MVRMEHAPIRPLPASVPGLGAGRGRGCLLGLVPSRGHAGCTAGGTAKAAARTASGPSLLIGMGRVPLSPPDFVILITTGGSVTVTTRGCAVPYHTMYGMVWYHTIPYHTIPWGRGGVPPRNVPTSKETADHSGKMSLPARKCESVFEVKLFTMSVGREILPKCSPRHPQRLW